MPEFKTRLTSEHLWEVFPTEPTRDEEMEKNLGGGGWMNVLYECDWMNVQKIENKPKRVASTYKPFGFLVGWFCFLWILFLKEC
jgi:hypothetical protein